MGLDFVCSRLIPSRNTSEVPIEVEIVLSCIMDYVHINVGGDCADRVQMVPSIKPQHFDSLTSLYSIVDVLESKVGTLKQEVVALTAPPSTSQPNPCEHGGAPSLKHLEVTSYDWSMGYESDSKLVFDEETIISTSPTSSALECMMSILPGHWVEWRGNLPWTSFAG
ncbi:hypothetical protein HAX54_000212 [Datura stramonium]|uniref:Uncharacterized protein n=1 Tax=Datura stramonium TaxID=4076 RepID=A0ABS8T0R2_DATST|nr:hypothetical protein [Datura stramonium]